MVFDKLLYLRVGQEDPAQGERIIGEKLLGMDPPEQTSAVVPEDLQDTSSDGVAALSLMRPSEHDDAIGSAFDFMTPHSCATTAEPEAAPEDERVSAFSFISNGSALSDDTAAAVKGEGSEPEVSGFSFITSSSLSKGSFTSEHDQAEFDDVTTSNAAAAADGGGVGSAMSGVAIEGGGDGRGNASAFSFLTAGTLASSPVRTHAATQPSALATGDRNSHEDVSAFSFLTSAPAATTPTSTLPSIPIDPLLRSVSSSTSSSYTTGGLTRTHTASPDNSLLDTSIDIPMPTHTRASSNTSSTGYSGHLSDLMTLEPPPAPAIAGVSSAPITFDRTATQRTGIKKKKGHVKVGYARRNEDSVGVSAVQLQPQQTPPRTGSAGTGMVYSPVVMDGSSSGQERVQGVAGVGGLRRGSSAAELERSLGGSGGDRGRDHNGIAGHSSSPATRPGGTASRGTHDSPQPRLPVDTPPTAASAQTLSRPTSNPSPSPWLPTPKAPAVVVATTDATHTPVHMQRHQPQPAQQQPRAAPQAHPHPPEAMLSAARTKQQQQQQTTLAVTQTQQAGGSDGGGGGVRRTSDPPPLTRKPSDERKRSAGSGFFSTLFGLGVAGNGKQQQDESPSHRPPPSPVTPQKPPMRATAASAEPSVVYKRGAAAGGSTGNGSAAHATGHGRGTVLTDKANDSTPEDGNHRMQTLSTSSPSSLAQSDGAPQSSTHTHAWSPTTQKPSGGDVSSVATTMSTPTATAATTRFQRNASTSAPPQPFSLTSPTQHAPSSPSGVSAAASPQLPTHAHSAQTAHDHSSNGYKPSLNDDSRGMACPLERSKTSVEQVIKAFQQDATKLCFRQQEVRRNLSKLAADRQNLEKEQASLHKELRRYEVEQARHAELEEFDKAEALQHVIEQFKSQISERSKSLQAGLRDTEQLEQQRLQAQQEQRKVELEKLRSGTTQTLETESRRLAAEEDRIAMEMRQVQKEDAAIKEESGKVDSAISVQTAELNGRRAELQGAIEGVDHEIAQLEAALKAKYEERGKVLNELKETETEVAKIKAKFDRQLQRLREKERSIAESRQECEQEQKALDDQKRVHRQQAKAIESEEERMKALIDQVASEMDASTLLLSSMTTQGDEAKGPELGTSEAAQSKLKAAKVEVAEAEEKIQALSAQHDKLSSAVASLHEEMEDIDNKVPVLESSKKEAAAVKNYKEAGSRSKEIKALQQRRDDAQSEMEAAREQMHEITQRLKELQAALDDAKQRLAVKERESETRRVTVLLNQAKTLRRAKRELNKLPPCRVQSTAIILLQAELDALESEVDDLRNRFGIASDVTGDGDDGENVADDNEDNAVKEGVRTGSDEVAETIDDAEESDIPEAPVSNGPVAEGNEAKDAGESGHNQQARRVDDVHLEGVAAGTHASPPQQNHPSEEDVARAKELHVTMLALEEKLQTAVEAEDYELAGEVQEEMDAVREEMARLGAIDVVKLIMEEDGRVVDEDDEEGGDVHSECSVQPDMSEIETEGGMCSKRAEGAVEEVSSDGGIAEGSVTEDTEQASS